MDSAAVVLSREQAAHVHIMRCVVAALQDTPMVLKGGTALLLCYGLDRFSEDLDYDAPKKLNLESRLERALQRETSSFTIERTKDTDTVLRYRILYTAQGVEGRLKLEISFRDEIDSGTVTVGKGIRTYEAGQLIRQKANALKNRTAARDLYDIHFLASHYHSDFAPEVVKELRSLFQDVNQLEARFRAAFEDDDLFGNDAEMVESLILGIQQAIDQGFAQKWGGSMTKVEDPSDEWLTRINEKHVK